MKKNYILKLSLSAIQKIYTANEDMKSRIVKKREKKRKKNN